MLDYNPALRDAARDLRKHQTEAETRLWERLRRKQLCGVQFYRQKPLGSFIADFYCAAANLVIELDGKHHAEGNQLAYDQERTLQLEALGLHILRFDNQNVLQNIDVVVTQIQTTLLARIQFPPLKKGG
ncbi:MAG: endonuclease domain-containing protein [Candidatus Thiothrix putei]|uniref:Endonuclease domain-containing protein n=1 Tax=Candidatus Thiothrix putei TaxID=3080811 RepID=A0AA95H7U4_9GAMM|nr:MAG: endonuclease domain-containing protein [Candidatus Thiothrix putei]